MVHQFLRTIKSEELLLRAKSNAAAKPMGRVSELVEEKKL
jgi:hypothetical protein